MRSCIGSCRMAHQEAPTPLSMALLHLMQAPTRPGVAFW